MKPDDSNSSGTSASQYTQIKFIVANTQAEDAKYSFIFLDGKAIHYRCISSMYDEKVLLQIDKEGLEVTAPSYLSTSNIEKTIRLHKNWILQKLDTSYHVHAYDQLSTGKMQNEITLLGNTYKIVSHPCYKNVHIESKEFLCIPESLENENAFEEWLQQKTLIIFRAKLKKILSVLSINIRIDIALSYGKKTWSRFYPSKNLLLLNLKLIHLPHSVIDYSIVYHIAMLYMDKVKNKHFWHMIKRICCNYSEVQKALKLQKPDQY